MDWFYSAVLRGLLWIQFKISLNTYIFADNQVMYAYDDRKMVLKSYLTGFFSGYQREKDYDKNYVKDRECFKRI